jgi:2-hydroxycyclohexanecarboxyl-CoA dehydrogenase
MTANPHRLEDKVAIVTGSGRGIGRGIALAFGKAGARVAVASRTERSVAEVVAAIEEAGGSAKGVICDVGDREQVFNMVESTVRHFGGLDVLVNNAQGFGTAKNPTVGNIHMPLEDFDEDVWEYTFRTGLMATMWAMKAAFPHMKERGGKIINFGSQGGQRGTAGTAAYNAAKEGIRALTRTAAREWGRYGINVNVINPAIWTDAMDSYFAQQSPEFKEAQLAEVPLRGFGTPEDVGAVAVFLASKDSDFITGDTIMLDSGRFMSA